jgi:hypothetical protein
VKCKYCIGELFFVNTIFIGEQKVTFYQCKHCKMLEIRTEKVEGAITK